MALNGVLLVDKEIGRTSFETVQFVKRRLGAEKAGHAGTLDKSATGLLIVCVGNGTGIQDILTRQEKKYRAVVYFGIETDTLDRYGSLVRTGCVRERDEKKILEILNGFKGVISQVPPLYSAIHHNGRRLYQIARKGEPLSPEPRKVFIRGIDLLKTEACRMTIEVRASKGTYIRSLARDIGSRLGTCAYLEELRRLEVGPLSVRDAYAPRLIDRNTPLMTINDALSFLPALHVDGRAAPSIRNGVPLAGILDGMGCENMNEGYFRIIHGGECIAVGSGGEKPSYVKVFSG